MGESLHYLYGVSFVKRKITFVNKEVCDIAVFLNGISLGPLIANALEINCSVYTSNLDTC